MKLRVRVLAALAAISLAAISGCVVYPARGYAYTDVEVAPPPPRVVITPAVRPGYVWAPGYWRWDGRRHVWVEGHYIRERRGYHWRAAHWEERNGRYHFEPGRWER